MGWLRRGRAGRGCELGRFVWVAEGIAGEKCKVLENVNGGVYLSDYKAVAGTWCCCDSMGLITRVDELRITFMGRKSRVRTSPTK